MTDELNRASDNIADMGIVVHMSEREATSVCWTRNDSLPPVAEVGEAYGWNCNICTEPIDRNKHYPDPEGPVRDHVIPYGWGGPHELSNLRLAHNYCNEFKLFVYWPKILKGHITNRRELDRAISAAEDWDNERIHYLFLRHCRGYKGSPSEFRHRDGARELMKHAAVSVDPDEMVQES